MDDMTSDELNKVLMELLGEGLVEMSWDNDENDFVFWWVGDKKEGE